MNKFVNTLQNVLLPVANAMNRNRYIKAMKSGLSLSLPFIIVSSILTSVASLDFFDNLLGNSLMVQVRAFLAPTSTMSSSIIGLFVVVGISYYLAKDYKLSALHGAMTATVMFLITCPSTLTTEGGETIKNVLSLNYLGASAMFSAIICAIVGVELYRWAINHKLTVNLPDSVPSSIRDSFTSFIPAGFAMLFGLVVRQLFLMTPQGNLTDFFFYWIQKPMSGIVLSYPAMLLYGSLVNLFWFFGLHGQQMTKSVFKPFLIAANAENIEAVAAGLPLPNIINDSFARAFILYGYWISIPLLIAIYIFAKRHKRNDWRKIANVSLVPGLFNIYEPLMFGFPLVLNPFTLIPMLLTPLITTSVFYFLTVTNIIPICNGVTVPSTTPIFVAGAMMTNSFLAGAVQVLLLIPFTAMWYFFLKLQDKSERLTGIYNEEADNETE